MCNFVLVLISIYVRQVRAYVNNPRHALAELPYATRDPLTLFIFCADVIVIMLVATGAQTNFRHQVNLAQNQATIWVIVQCC